MYRKAGDRLSYIADVDRRIRDSVQLMWESQRNTDEPKSLQRLETDLHRLLERALSDFKEDIDLYWDQDLERSSRPN